MEYERIEETLFSKEAEAFLYDGISYSLPFPGWKEGKMIDIVFLFCSANDENKKLIDGYLCLDSVAGNIESYCKLDCEEIDESWGSFEEEEEYKRLYMCIREIAYCYYLDDSQKQELQAFIGCMNKVFSMDLIRKFNWVNPRFEKWSKNVLSK